MVVSTRPTRIAGIFLSAQILATCTWGLEFPDYPECEDGHIDLLTDSEYCGFRAEVADTIELSEDTRFGGFPVLVAVVEDHAVVVSIQTVIDGTCSGLEYHADLYAITDGERLEALGGATFESPEARVNFVASESARQPACNERNFQLILPMQASLVPTESGGWLIGIAAGESGVLLGELEEGASSFSSEEVIGGDLFQADVPTSRSTCDLGQCVLDSTSITARFCRSASLADGVAPVHGDCDIGEICSPSSDGFLGVCVPAECDQTACEPENFAVCGGDDTCYPLCSADADCPGYGTCFIEDEEAVGVCVTRCPDVPCTGLDTCIDGLCVADCASNEQCGAESFCIEGICSPRFECYEADRFGDPVAVGCGIGVVSYYDTEYLSFAAATGIEFIRRDDELVALVPSGLGGVWRIGFDGITPVSMSNAFYPMNTIRVAGDTLWGVRSDGYLTRVDLDSLLAVDGGEALTADESTSEPISAGFAYGANIAVAGDSVFVAAFPTTEDPTISVVRVATADGELVIAETAAVGPGNLASLGVIDPSTLGLVRLTISQQVDVGLDWAASTSLFDLAEETFDDAFIEERFDSTTEGDLSARGVGFGDGVMILARPDRVVLYVYQRDRGEL